LKLDLDRELAKILGGAAASSNVIQICDKCRHMSLKTSVAKLKKLAPGADIKIGCKNYCGPCAKYAFIYVNGRFVKGATEDEAIEKARPFIK